MKRNEKYWNYDAKVKIYANTKHNEQKKKEEENSFNLRIAKGQPKLDLKHKIYLITKICIKYTQRIQSCRTIRIQRQQFKKKERKIREKRQKNIVDIIQLEANINNNFILSSSFYPWHCTTAVLFQVKSMFIAHIHFDSSYFSSPFNNLFLFFLVCFTCAHSGTRKRVQNENNS